MNFPEWLRDWVNADKFYLGEDSPYFPQVGALAKLTALQHEALERAVEQACDDEGVERSPCACDWCSAWANAVNVIQAGRDFREKYGGVR